MQRDYQHKDAFIQQEEGEKSCKEEKTAVQNAAYSLKRTWSTVHIAVRSMLEASAKTYKRTWDRTL